MKAVRAHGVRDVRTDELPHPGEPGPCEILVKPIWCGLCGSDVKNYLGTGVGAGGPLRVMGHEFSALITAVGAGVDPARIGDHVAVMPVEHCGRCDDCARGDFYHCAHRSFLGLSGERALGGGLADYVLIRDYQAVLLDGLSDEDGALVEPAAVAMNAVLEARVSPGSFVLVVGCGAIGALVVLAAQAAGAAGIYVSEPNPQRARRAERLGATVLSRAPVAEQLEQLKVLAGPHAAIDVAFDCAGKEGAFEMCIGAIKSGGTICVVAGRFNAPLVDIAGIQQLPVTVIGSLAYTRRAWDMTMALMRVGKYQPGRTVTSRISRNRIVSDGFDALLDPVGDQLKVLVNVGEHE